MDLLGLAGKFSSSGMPMSASQLFYRPLITQITILLLDRLWILVWQKPTTSRETGQAGEGASHSPSWLSWTVSSSQHTCCEVRRRRRRQRRRRNNQIRGFITYQKMFWLPYMYYLVSFLPQLWEASIFPQFYWWGIWKQKYYVTYPKIHYEEISELGFKHRFVLFQSLFIPLVTFHFAFQSVPLNRPIKDYTGWDPGLSQMISRSYGKNDLEITPLVIVWRSYSHERYSLNCFWHHLHP